MILAVEGACAQLATHCAGRYHANASVQGSGLVGIEKRRVSLRIGNRRHESDTDSQVSVTFRARAIPSNDATARARNGNRLWERVCQAERRAGFSHEPRQAP